MVMTMQVERFLITLTIRLDKERFLLREIDIGEIETMSRIRHSVILEPALLFSNANLTR